MTENSKWFDLLSRFLMPMAAFLNNSRYLQTLRDAFMLAFPITMFGSLIVVVANLPFLDKFMSPGVLDAFKTSLGNAPSATMGIMSLFVVFGIGYYLSKSYEVEAVFGGSSPSSRSYYLLRSSSRSKTSRIRWVTSSRSTDSARRACSSP